MPRARTTADLLTDVRARVAAPAANGLLTSAELLTLCDEEMRGEVAALLVSLRSEYWLRTYETSITANVASYRIPDRSLGMGLRDVTIYNSDGREWNAIQVPAEHRYFYAGATWSPSGPFAFTLSDGELVLLPTPAAAGYSLRLRYYATPSRLVPLESGTAISAATALSLTVDDDTVGDIATAGTLFDVVRGAGMHEQLASDLLVVAYDSGTGVVDISSPGMSAEQVSSISVGAAHAGKRIDYACNAGETVFPPIPEVLWPMLVSASARAYCEAIGDARGMEVAGAMLDRRRRLALSMMQPRVDGEVMRPVPIFTPLRSGRTRWR